MISYSIVLRDAIHHGILAGVALPEAPDVPPDVVGQLHPDERALAATLRGHAAVAFVGGRLAARAAAAGLQRSLGPVLRDGRGAPTCDPRLSLSISHKKRLAVALLADSRHGTLGVDLEDLDGPPRLTIAPRVLRDVELRALDALPEERRWTALLLRFVLKEAIYKALAPRLQRYIGFEEAEVTPRPDGTADVVLHLASGSPPRGLDARFVWLPSHVLGTVRAQW